MTNRNTAYLALRLFSLYIIITNFMLSAQNIIFGLNNSSGTVAPIQITLIFIYLSPLLIGIYLWLASEKLSGHFVLHEPHEDEASNESPLNIYKIAIVIMGLYFAISAIPWLASNMQSYFLNAEQLAHNEALKKGMMVNFTLHICSLLIGFSMVAGNKFYIKAIQYFQNIALENKK